MTIVLGLGVVFEMPILVFFLALFGLISPGWMWRNFRYSILGIFVIAAIITPTPDIMNMCIFAAPMIVLYLLSIGSRLPGASQAAQEAGIEPAMSNGHRTLLQSVPPQSFPTTRSRQAVLALLLAASALLAGGCHESTTGAGSAAAQTQAASRPEMRAAGFRSQAGDAPSSEDQRREGLPEPEGFRGTRTAFPGQQRTRQGGTVHPRAPGRRAGRAGQVQRADRGRGRFR